jgi:hypothetical protein
VNDCFLKIKKSICKSRLCISKRAWASRTAIILRPLQTSFSAHFLRTKSRSRCFELSLLPSDITKLSVLPLVVRCKRKENHFFRKIKYMPESEWSRTLGRSRFTIFHGQAWILMEWNLILVFVSLIGSVTVSELESTVPDIIFSPSQIVGNWPSPRSSRNHDHW